MNKGIFILLLTLTTAIAASATPNPQSQSVKQNIAAFVGSHFGSSTLCPLPPALPKNLPADWNLQSISMLLQQWNHKAWCANTGQFDPDLAALFSDLQNFLATQHIDPTVLADLKSWISKLPIDPNKIEELENWLQTLGTYCNDTVAVEIDSATSKHIGASQPSVDQPVTAVPEPSTISTFVLGIGLLGGVMLRLRPRPTK